MSIWLSFVGGFPLNYIDPSGHCWISIPVVEVSIEIPDILCPGDRADEPIVELPPVDELEIPIFDNPQSDDELEIPIFDNLDDPSDFEVPIFDGIFGKTRQGDVDDSGLWGNKSGGPRADMSKRNPEDIIIKELCKMLGGCSKDDRERIGEAIHKEKDNGSGDDGDRLSIGTLISIFEEVTGEKFSDEEREKAETIFDNNQGKQKQPEKPDPNNLPPDDYTA
jgi:hypothetical protein